MKLKTKTLFCVTALLMGTLTFTGCSNSSNDDEEERNSYRDVIEMYFEAIEDEDVDTIIEIGYPDFLYSDETQEAIREDEEEWHEWAHDYYDDDEKEFYLKYKNIDFVSNDELTTSDFEEMLNLYVDDAPEIEIDKAYEVSITYEEYEFENDEWHDSSAIYIVYEIDDEWYILLM